MAVHSNRYRAQPPFQQFYTCVQLAGSGGNVELNLWDGWVFAPVARGHAQKTRVAVRAEANSRGRPISASATIISVHLILHH